MKVQTFLLTLITLFFFTHLYASDMIAITGDITEVSRKYAFDFFVSRSKSRSNNDGYGAAYFTEGWQTVYKSGRRRWYADGGLEPLDETKDWGIGEAEVGETLFLHALDAAKGYGNQPFMIKSGEIHWAFMHNGKLYDKLYLYMLEYLGEWWFQENPSNWTDEINKIIDSEIFFHYLISRNKSGFTFAETLNDLRFLEQDQTKKSVLNFIMSDGTTLYAFRNSTNKDFEYKLSWKLDKGCLTIKTDQRHGKMLLTNELLIFEDGEIQHVMIDE